jgi:hypothetical protein
LNAIITSPNLKTKITSIRSGGQTGFDEAGAKAGLKLGLPTTVLAPKDWEFRTNEGNIKSEKAFKSRFGVQPATEAVEEQTNDLITTPDPNIFLYDDSKDDSAAFYKKLTSTNSTVGFVYNATKFEIDNNKDLPGQGYLRLVSKDTALPFVTSLTSNFDNFSNLAADKYQSVKNYFDRKIQELKNAKDLGNKIALPKAGIGDAKKMPQELFVYLSKRLFEELGYLNPGSSAYKDITEIISNKQGISDDEILASLGFESDPFNCV